MRRALTLLLLLAVGFDAAADRYEPDNRDLESVPLHETPASELQKALAAPRKNRPVQFAVGVPTTLALADGAWKSRDAQTRSWRMRIRSPDARSINLEFARFDLPEGAGLWLYDPAGRVVQGPYTAANRNALGRLWTAIVPGAEVVLELRVAAGTEDAVALEVGKVNHAFADFAKDGTSSKSGSCNIDVTCPQGDPWRKEIRSVARISIGGTYLCSGQLVNNLAQDLKPLFLTADHCRIGESGDLAAESVVFYWNYQSSQCGGNPDGSIAQNQTGSTFVADNQSSDFTLVRLLESPRSEFNVYYAGWNAGSGTPGSGAAIHHPNGDEKRISLYGSQAVEPTRCDIGEGRVVDAWRVVWSEGTTEPGSSGGGLWDQGNRLVGTLSGGNASCDKQNEWDCFARLDLAWQRSSSASHQLKAHLDPDNTGCRQMPGRDPNDPPAQIDTSQCTPVGSGGGSGGGLFLGTTTPSLMLFALLGLALRQGLSRPS